MTYDEAREYIVEMVRRIESEGNSVVVDMPECCKDCDFCGMLMTDNEACCEMTEDENDCECDEID